MTSFAQQPGSTKRYGGQGVPRPQAKNLPTPGLRPAPATPTQLPSGGGLSGTATSRPVLNIDDSTTEAAAQNRLALGQANGDLRYQTKNLSRPGMSSGKGQEYQGALKSAQAISEAAGEAADIRSQDQMANAKMRSDQQKMQEQEAMSQAMVQHVMSQSDWGRDFAQQSANAQNQMAYLQAMLQLRLSLMR